MYVVIPTDRTIVDGLSHWALSALVAEIRPGATIQACVALARQQGHPALTRTIQEQATAAEALMTCTTAAMRCVEQHFQTRMALLRDLRSATACEHVSDTVMVLDGSSKRRVRSRNVPVYVAFWRLAHIQTTLLSGVCDNNATNAVEFYAHLQSLWHESALQGHTKNISSAFERIKQLCGDTPSAVEPAG